MCGGITKNRKRKKCFADCEKTKSYCEKTCNKKRKCKKSKCDMCEATCKKPCKIIDCKDIMEKTTDANRKKKSAKRSDPA